jgi:hypothetical protein
VQLNVGGFWQLTIFDWQFPSSTIQTSKYQRICLMLAIITFITNLITIGLTLWLGLYLFARGFPNGIAMRAVLSLLAFSAFLLGAHTNFFVEVQGMVSIRAVLLIIGLACWYSLTFQLLLARNQKRFQWLRLSILILCLATAVLLVITRNAFTTEQDNLLYLAQTQQGGLPYALYGFTQIVTSLGLLFNLLVEERVRFTSEGKSLLFASIFPSLMVLYEVLALITADLPLPRLIQHVLIFIGVFALGISVARHESLIERRTILQDFPATGLLIFGLVAVYILISLNIGISTSRLGLVIVVVILTHSIFDMGREALERSRSRKESRFRKQWHLIENGNTHDNKLQLYLKDGLDLLCQTLNASAGVIAIRQGEKMVVIASRNSVRLGTEISQDLAVYEDVSRATGQLLNIVWICAAFERQTQIALIGIGASNTKMEYSAGDRDLLAEFADQVGIVVSIANLQPQTKEQIRQLVEEAQAQAVEMQSAAGGMIESLAFNPDTEFIRMVEDCLRHYMDFIRLGQSPLADWMRLEGDHHTERGKQLQKLLREAIEALRPSGPLPEELLNKSWYSYVVIHDAYMNGITNRAIMARLFISEGTFNRTRRNALRSVARWLVEEKRQRRRNYEVPPNQ